MEQNQLNSFLSDPNAICIYRNSTMTYLLSMNAAIDLHVQ